MSDSAIAPPPPATVPHKAAHEIRRSAVVSWVLYDLANTIFSMGVISLYFSLWVRDQVGAERADTTYGIISAISMGIIFMVSPLLGAMTDRAPRRIPFLVVSTLVCVAFTTLLARSGFYVTAVCFIIANVAYQAGLQFYDALLPEVSTEENRGRIGGIGVGVGYIGSYFAVGIGILLGTGNKPFLFTAIAAAFLVLSIPCFLFVRERGNPNPRRIDWAMARDSSSQTIRTLREGQRYPGLVRFLVGRVFYTDAINTVISIMALYTVNIAVSTGMSEADGQEQAQFILMSAITFAVLGGFFWGWMTDRHGPRRTLNLVLTAWMAIFAFAGAIGILGLPLWCLYVVAASAGVALGGVWAADRPYMLRLTPPARVGEFYGLYGMVGRFSAITGPIVWAIVTYVTVQLFDLAPRVGQGIGVLVLLGMVALSYFILQPISDAPRDWSPEDRGEGPAAAAPARGTERPAVCPLARNGRGRNHQGGSSVADWHRGIARFLDRVDTKIDEQRRRMGATGGAGKQARIDPYRGFGTPERGVVRGRVLRGSPIPTAGAADSALLNLAAMVQRFESDEVPRARVRVVFAGGERTVTANDEGFFECEVEPRPPFASGALWHEVVLELAEPRDGDEPYRTLGHVLVPPAGSAFGVISDLDDTVIRTGVTSKLRMARTVLFGNARTRAPFPGVGAFYRALQHGTGSAPFNPIFYVSSSPWNLHDLLTEFLSLQKIPLGPLLLRDWGLSGEVLPTSNEEHKMAAIRRIMEHFPTLSFILVGDTSQEDPEIYARVVHRYPDRVLAVYIRNVEAQPDRVAAIRVLAAEVEKAGSALILADDTLAAAEHAASRGWISPDALAEVRAEVEASAQPRATRAGGEVNEELSTS